jgi:hypothetical protein
MAFDALENMRDLVHQNVREDEGTQRKRAQTRERGYT